MPVAVGVAARETVSLGTHVTSHFICRYVRVDEADVGCLVVSYIPDYAVGIAGCAPQRGCSALQLCIGTEKSILLSASGLWIDGLGYIFTLPSRTYGTVGKRKSELAHRRRCIWCADKPCGLCVDSQLPLQYCRCGNAVGRLVGGI